MRALFLCQRVPYPPNKGEKLRTYHQIEYLVEQGFDVDVLALGESEQDSIDCQALSARVHKAHCERLGQKGWRYIRAILTGRAMSESYFYSASMQDCFAQWVEDTHYDLIILTASSLYPYVAHLNDSVLAQSTLLFDFMDVDSDKWQQYAQTSSWPMAWVYQREASCIHALERLAVHKSEQAFLIADKEKELFLQNHSLDMADKISVLGNGIDDSVFYPVRRRPGAANRLLFVGVMDYKPNVDAMLWFVEYVWPSLKMQNPKAILTIVGMNPSKEIRKLGKLQDIHVTGMVDDVVPYFHDADVFVAPFQIARGVQNKILQAMACGLPVIGSQLGFEGIEIAEGQDGFVANHVSEYLLGLERLSDPQEYAKVSKAAVNTIIQKYSWSGQLRALQTFMPKVWAEAKKKDCA